LFSLYQEQPEMNQLVITIVGKDRAGIVENLSAIVADHDGNWLSSSMNNLAGQFAGMIEVAVADDQREALATAIGNLPDLQVHSVVGDTADGLDELPMAELEVVGIDHPGIVSRLTEVLKSKGVNLVQFASWCETAPNSGENLFRAVAEFELPSTLDLESLKGALEELAGDIAVDIELAVED
jgi:glycine cleavage system regulatory protein